MLVKECGVHGINRVKVNTFSQKGIKATIKIYG
jgi:hypothetical protein